MKPLRSPSQTLCNILVPLLAPLLYGLSLPMLPLLMPSMSPPHTRLLLTATLFASALLANILSTLLAAEQISSMFLLCLLFASGYLLNMLGLLPLVARALLGLAAGLAGSSVPCYLSGVSPIQYRGVVSSLYGPAIIAGIILGQAMVYYRVTLYYYALAGVIISAVGGSLVLLCSKKHIIRESPLGLFPFLSSWKARRSLLLMLICHSAQHLTGINHLLFKSADIFVGSDATLMSLYLFVFALCTSLLSCSTVELLGRKILLLVSCATLGACCVAFYFSFNTEFFAYLFILGYNIGLANVPFVLMGEIFPIETMGYGALFSTSCNWLSALASQFFLVEKTISYNPSFLFYSGFSLAAALSILLLYKETRLKMPMYQ